eukprot:jgi/Undpi1/12594/HiC_scaffold_6.g02263.m1
MEPTSSPENARGKEGGEEDVLGPTSAAIAPGEGTGKRVVVGMSGGVDSSVVAMLLQQQASGCRVGGRHHAQQWACGYEVVGVFMRNWDAQDEEGGGACTADADLEDARMVGAHLGIPVETVDFSREYWHQVFAPSLEEFAQCRTPNMDVACNRFIKFDAFRKHALEKMGADLVATGHYARTGCGTGSHGDGDRPVLLQAVDENKDQTYFLCGVPSSALAKVTENGNGDVSDDGNGIGSGWCWLW